MWAVGCIVAEMFVGRPLLPGSSTMNQLERILRLCGRPSAADVAAIRSDFAATMLGSLSSGPDAGPAQEDMAALMKGAPPDAVDLVVRLMDFNPERRLDVEAALKHPYMAAFVTGSEPSCPGRRALSPPPALTCLPACRRHAPLQLQLLPTPHRLSMPIPRPRPRLCVGFPFPSTTTTNLQLTTTGNGSTSRS